MCVYIYIYIYIYIEREREREREREKEMATHPGIFAGRIPQTEEPVRLWSIGSQSWTRLKQLSMMYICIHTYTNYSVGGV